LSSKVARVLKDSQFPLFGNVSIILTLASKWGCDRNSHHTCTAILKLSSQSTINKQTIYKQKCLELSSNRGQTCFTCTTNKETINKNMHKKYE